MAKCEFCGKDMAFGIKVSHSHRRSNRTWKPNVKRVKAIVDGSPKHVYACTRCLRSGKVTRYAMAGVPTTYELGAFIGAQEGLSYFVDNENGHAGTPTEVLFGKEGTFRNFLEHWKKLADTGYLNSIG